MSKYPIKRKFFPFSHFTPSISEKFLAMAVPHIKAPLYIYRHKELDVTQYEVTSYDGEKIECFMMSPKSLSGKTPFNTISC